METPREKQDLGTDGWERKIKKMDQLHMAQLCIAVQLLCWLLGHSQVFTSCLRVPVKGLMSEYLPDKRFGLGYMSRLGKE